MEFINCPYFNRIISRCSSERLSMNGRDRFFLDDNVTIADDLQRGAIAIAANGIPIFNPVNASGLISKEIGELDDFGGHSGRADDYHYHAAPGRPPSRSPPPGTGRASTRLSSTGTCDPAGGSRRAALAARRDPGLAGLPPARRRRSSCPPPRSRRRQPESGGRSESTRPARRSGGGARRASSLPSVSPDFQSPAHKPGACWASVSPMVPGLIETATPRDSSAAILSLAAPLPPAMIAPA